MIIGNVVFPSLLRRDNGGITNKNRYHSDTTPKDDRMNSEGRAKRNRALGLRRPKRHQAHVTEKSEQKRTKNPTFSPKKCTFSKKVHFFCIFFFTLTTFSSLL